MKTQLELISRISWSSGYKNQIWEFWRFEREDSLLGQNNKREGSVGARHKSQNKIYEKSKDTVTRLKYFILLSK